MIGHVSIRSQLTNIQTQVHSYTQTFLELTSLGPDNRKEYKNNFFSMKNLYNISDKSIK